LRKIQIIVLIVLVAAVCAFGQNKTNDDNIWEAPQKDSLLVILDAIYNLEFEKYEKSAAGYKERFPERPEGVFAEAVAIWMKVLSDLYNPQFDDLFMSKLDSIIEVLEDYPDEHQLAPVAKFYIDAATGFKAILHVTRENWFSAALEGRKAIGGIRQALEGKIPNPDARLGTGLYLYYADIMPQRYPILKPLFLFYPDGDKEKGLADLQYTAEHGLFAKVVATYMYAVILYLRENRFLEANHLLRELTNQYPQNPIFMMWQASVATRIGRFREAEELLNTYSERVRRNVPYYSEHKMRIVNYRYGLIYSRTNRHEEALGYLEKAMQPLPEPMHSKLLHYVVYAALQAGYSLERLKRWSEARDMFRRVLDLEEYRNSHDTARKHLKNLENHFSG